ncbi:MAG: dehydrogenase E1 component subunit alpha/beta [Urechidicola sp.]|nr:dehydrogenase E1 component subunit alpha/beta [Urechidicola sp.]
MNYNSDNFTKKQLITLYKALLRPRMIEEKMLILLRQGKISKWFCGIGQEAIPVGVASALNDDEYILPMHRNLGVFTTRKIPLYRLFSQWQGKLNGFTKGRDRSFHFGTQEFNIIGMISHLGPQLGVADGIALGNLLKKNNKVTAVFSGEGGSSEGDFHEALNIASVWKLPVLFCIEHNGYGLSTPSVDQFANQNFADKGIGYGMESHTIDGNNILEVYSIVSELAEDVRKNPRPILLEFKTFRMHGHEEASGTKYVPKELMEEWAKKDPVDNFREFLLDKNVLTKSENEAFKKEITTEINENLKLAFDEKIIETSAQKELEDVYMDFDYQQINPSNNKTNIRFVDAISKGLEQAMERHEDMIIMGQDIAEYGGVFKITEGFLEKFGKQRIRNTPICESGIIEAAYGLAVNGIKSVVELQFSDFVTSGFNPVVNLLAKSHYRWGQNANILLRMPCGGGLSAGPFHSQTNESWFTKTPGLKVVYPAFPQDAKGLLATSIEDPNPVLFFEHKGLYRTIREDVTDDYFTIPFGKANLLKEGNVVSIISYGLGVHWALDTISDTNISADLIDLRTLNPLDIETIIASVKKTGKVIILQEDSMFGGMASDLSALITEQCFEFLDAPVMRCASLETPIPFASQIEEIYLSKNRFKEKLQELLNY